MDDDKYEDEDRIEEMADAALRRSFLIFGIFAGLGAIAYLMG